MRRTARRTGAGWPVGGTWGQRARYLRIDGSSGIAIISTPTPIRTGCRTIRSGMTAQEAAGVIHSDFVNKFIRAEVVHYDDFIAAEGSFAKAKEAGHWRLEGKTYIVRDGDILNIRHS